MKITRFLVFFLIVVLSVFIIGSCSKETSSNKQDISKQSVDQSPAVYLTNLGIDYARAGQYDSAIIMYNRAIEKDSTHGDAFSNRAAIFAATGQYDSAINDFTRAIECNPDKADNYANRGGLYYRVGNFGKAVEDCNTSLFHDSMNLTAYINRGAAYAELDQNDLALDDYSRAITIDSLNPSGYVNRGLFYMTKLGDKDKACEDWKKACELGRCDNYKLAQQNGDCP